MSCLLTNNEGAMHLTKFIGISMEVLTAWLGKHEWLQVGSEVVEPTEEEPSVHLEHHSYLSTVGTILEVTYRMTGKGENAIGVVEYIYSCSILK